MSGPAFSPVPTEPQAWVAVLMTLARHLTRAGHEPAAERVYAAAATFAEAE